jgi:O-antigen/teichoic acid export membrane protein
MLAGFPLAGVVLACLALRSASTHGAALRVGAWRGVLATWRETSAFAGSEVLNQFYARADLLLIAYFLGDAKVGLYATDIKFVEVGILPLVLLGTAAYPLLSAPGAGARGPLSQAGRDFMRIVFFCSGWLAVAIYTLLPLLIVPIFGPKFAPSAALLPWFALFALLKGWEVAFYRLLYAVHRQSFYFGSLLVGTVLIVILNWELIPAHGILGAIVAAIICITAVDLICAAGLLRQLRAQFLVSVTVRLAAAMGLTGAILAAAQRMAGTGQWSSAIIACTLYPLLGMLCGLLPHPKRSPLLRHTGVENS